VLAVLKRFGYDVDNLNGEKVHSLYNVMSLKPDVHESFDSLYFWFEATVSVTNAYISLSSMTHAYLPPN
jgi:hypothetical protein